MADAISSNHIRNRTQEYPASTDVFRHLLNKLIADGGEHWIHFDGPGKEAWVEVANDLNGFLELNFSFPFQDNLEELFAKKEIVVPTGWKIHKYKPKRLGGLFAGYACYSVPQNESDSLILFIDDLFMKLFDCDKDYPVSGYLT